MSRQLVLLDDRIRDQRVRRPQRPVEGGGREPVAERKDEKKAEDEGEREGERAERESRLAVALELVEVELEPREEHEKEQPELAQRLDDALAVNPVEDERPHQHPAQHDPDQPREPEALGDHGSGEQHDGSHEERPLGGHRRELDGQRHAVSLNAATDGLRAQKISGHHGARSAANIASARAAAPRRSSSTLPPRTRPENENAPRYALPSALTSSRSCAAGRRPLGAAARDAPAPGVPRAELVDHVEDDGAVRRVRARRQSRTDVDEPHPEPVADTLPHVPRSREEPPERVIDRQEARSRPRRTSRCRGGTARALLSAARRARPPRRPGARRSRAPPPTSACAGRSRTPRVGRHVSRTTNRFGPPSPPPPGGSNRIRSSHQVRVRASIPGVRRRTRSHTRGKSVERLVGIDDAERPYALERPRERRPRPSESTPPRTGRPSRSRSGRRSCPRTPTAAREARRARARRRAARASSPAARRDGDASGTCRRR